MFMFQTKPEKKLSATILAILFTFGSLRQITLETVGGIIMHVNLFNKTIIYERIVGKIASIYIT